MNAVRIVVGAGFVLAGTGKLLLPLLIPILRPGSPDFAAVLAQLGVPLPSLTAILVCLVEIGGGAALLLGRGMALASLLLAADLVGAMVTLSVPAALGRPLVIGGLTLGNEIWRLPVEISMLAGALAVGRPWRLVFRR